MKHRIGTFTLFASILLALTAQAQDTRAFQLSLFPDAQIVSKTDSVQGVRLAIWSENQNMSGFDLGIANVTNGDFSGLGLGVVNLTQGNAKGVQLGIWGVNLTAGDYAGWSSATFFNRVEGSFTGLQGSLVSITKQDVSGWQAGLIYAHTGGHISGLQTGLVNSASSVKGLQFGLVNITENMQGVQIGLANIIKNSSLPFFPIVNAKF